MTDIIDSVPGMSPEMAMPPVEMVPGMNRMRLGGDELSICGVIDLAPSKTEGNPPAARVLVLDVGFRGKEGSYGPYDIDGSGQKRTFTKPYVLVSKVETTDGTQTRFFEMNQDETVVLGRMGRTSSLLPTHGNKVSRKHATIFFDSHDNLQVQDQGSANGTKLRSPGEIARPSSSNFGYTKGIEDYVHRAGKSYMHESAEVTFGRGHGIFGERPIVARDTEINGGVYPVGGIGGEALVIDDKKYPKELNEVYDRVLAAVPEVSAKRLGLSGLRKRFAKEASVPEASATVHTLNKVFSEVRKTLRYDLDATNAIAKDSKKVALNSYIIKGVGVCRTQGVLSAYVLERMVNEGKLQGRVSIDRNSQHDVPGGHTWARFTDENGTVFIIDPAQEFVGTLAQATSDRTKWDYRRTEDILQELYAA